MPKTLSVPTGASAEAVENKQSLGNVVSRIHKAIKESLDWRMQVGVQLKIIKDDELYTQQDYETFGEFIEACFPDHLTVRGANDLVTVATLYQELQHGLEGRSDKVQMPTSENQIRALLKYSPSEALELYVGAFKEAQRTRANFTGDFVRQYVNSGIREIESSPVPTPEPKTPDQTWSQNELDTSDVYDFSDEKTTAKKWSTEAGEALKRIESLCKEGVLKPDIAASIKTQAKSVPDDELSRLGRFAEPKFTQMARLMFHGNVPFWRASRVIEKELDGKAAVEDLVYKAIALNQAIHLTLGAWTISCTLT